MKVGRRCRLSISSSREGTVGASLSRYPSKRAIPLCSNGGMVPGAPRLPSGPSGPGAPSTPDRPASNGLIQLSNVAQCSAVSQVISAIFPGSTSAMIITSKRGCPSTLTTSKFTKILSTPVLVASPRCLDGRAGSRVDHLGPREVVVVNKRGTMSKGIRRSLTRCTAIREVKNIAQDSATLGLCSDSIRNRGG